MQVLTHKLLATINLSVSRMIPALLFATSFQVHQNPNYYDHNSSTGQTEADNQKNDRSDGQGLKFRRHYRTQNRRNL